MRGSLIFLTGLVFVNIANYLYNILMGRLLGPADFGALTSLVSLLVIVTVPGTAVWTIAMKFTAEYKAAGESRAIKGLLLLLSRVLGTLGLLAIAVFAIASPQLAHFLKITDRGPIVLIGVAVLITLLIQANRGILQGEQRFAAYTGSTILESSLKLVLGVSLVMLGFRVFGGVAAIVLALAVAYGATFIPIRSLLRTAATPVSPRSLVGYSITTLLVIFFFSVMQNVDIILVKHYLAPAEAGLYAALSTIGKIVYYVAAPIAAVMFPMVVELTKKQERHVGLLAITLLLTVLVGLCVVGVFEFAPGLIIRLLYGSAYESIYQLLPTMGFAFLVLLVVNLFIQYFLAVTSNLAYIAITAIGALLLVASIIAHHTSALVVVREVLLSYSVTAGLLFACYLLLKREAIKQLLLQLIGNSV